MSGGAMLRVVKDEGYSTAELARAIGLYQSDVARLVSKGLIRATKVGSRWRIAPEDAEIYIASRVGLKSAIDLQERVAELEAEVATLRGPISAREALSALSAEEALELLASVDRSDMPWNQRFAIVETVAELERVVDVHELAAGSQTRPKGVAKTAVRRSISTAVGPIDIWYWPTPSGWRAKHGGPRPGGTVVRRNAAAAARWAGEEARRTYGKPIRLTSARTRFRILKRDGFACHYCGRKPPEVELHVDHVIPVAKGGTNADENLVTACAECNLGKSDL